MGLLPLTKRDLSPVLLLLLFALPPLQQQQPSRTTRRKPHEIASGVKSDENKLKTSKTSCLQKLNTSETSRFSTTQQTSRIKNIFQTQQEESHTKSLLEVKSDENTLNT